MCERLFCSFGGIYEKLLRMGARSKKHIRADADDAVAQPTSPRLHALVHVNNMQSIGLCCGICTFVYLPAVYKPRKTLVPRFVMK
jgi:hypothetical protein